ncbi:MAG: galactose mutarotase [Saprospiraceae bacterium]|jgi:aldose 1-epimerase|nr:galactose mutarotase [Saprospiraceae bacterium]
MHVQISNFGRINNSLISLITIKNNNNNCVQITNYGGIVHSWTCPDKDGKLHDILLGCKDLEAYCAGHPYFGAVIGRYANRIANGHFQLDNIDYDLSKNLPPNHLHGGFLGFDKKIWEPEVDVDDQQCLVKLSTESHDMEEGYPGNLVLNVHYTFNNDNELIIEYFASTDSTTIINMTNHCYFNLSGEQSENILDHEVMIEADYFTNTNAELIPTGEIAPVNGTVLDFRSFTEVKKFIPFDDMLLKSSKGFDHNFVLKRNGFTKPAATVRHKKSGRNLEIYTDQPGIQLYTGNWLNGVDGKSGKYTDYSGLCLETQHYPDSPNQPEFPDTKLVPGQAYYTKTIYKMTTQS